MQVIATDLVGPLPETKTGNQYILVVANCFTRWVEVFPLPNQEASTVAVKLVDDVLLYQSNFTPTKVGSLKHN